MQIFDLVEDADGEWIVMELVAGPTLAEILAESPLPVPQVIDVGRPELSDRRGCRAVVHGTNRWTTPVVQ